MIWLNKNTNYEVNLVSPPEVSQLAPENTHGWEKVLSFLGPTF